MSDICWLDTTHFPPYPTPRLKSMFESVDLQVRFAGQFLGSWRLVGSRHIPAFPFCRLLLGSHFGKPNTLVPASKRRNSGKNE